jgi:hypothetical protein
MPGAIIGALIAGAAAGASISAAGVFSFAFNYIAFGASLALSGLSRALAPKARRDQGTGFTGRTVTLRQPAAPRQVILGRARVGGTIVWLHARDNLGGDQWLHLAVVLAGHECDAIEEIWFDDYVLQLDADGWERGRYQVTDPAKGPLGSYVRVRRYLGAPGQAADPILMDFSDGKWTSRHTLTGCTYLAVLLTSNSNLFPNGIPQITAVVRGRKVLDPRSGLTAWSANSALLLRDYLVGADGPGVDAATGVHAATQLAAANVCDEWVPLGAGGNERRYETHGAYTLARTPREIITDLSNAMAGGAVRAGGVWYIEAGAYAPPTLTLTDDDLRAPETVRTRISRREGFNAVRGTFVSPTTNWQPDDFPPVRSSTFIAEDQGREAWKDIELPFTTSAGLAQRLAKIDLLRARQQITVELPCKLTALRFRPGNTVALTSSFYGWSAKAFRVVGLGLAVESDDSGAPRLGVNLTLREIAANVFDWSASEEAAYDPAPDTNLPDPFTVEPPGVPAITEEMYETTGSAGVKVRAVLTWGASTSPFVDTYQPEYRLAGAAAWTVRARTGALRDVIDDIDAGRYEFRVKAISARGVSSAYAERTQEIFALSGRPANVAGLTVQIVSSLALLRWTRHPDLDVRIGGRVLIRHTEDTVTPTWANSYAVTEPVPGDSTLALVPAKPGVYLLRAEDSTGNLSAAATTVTAGNADVLTFADVGTPVQEDPAFAGAKTSVVVNASKLELSGSGLWDSMGANFDTAAANLDAFGGYSASGSYVFATGIDLTTVKRVRMVATLAVETVQITTLFDSRTGMVDDWQDWDGPDAGGIGEALIEYRQTDDNPGGTPVWSAWRRLALVADATARAFQFRLSLSVSDPSYNIRVTQCRVKTQEVV